MGVLAGLAKLLVASSKADPETKKQIGTAIDQMSQAARQAKGQTRPMPKSEAAANSLAGLGIDPYKK